MRRATVGMLALIVLLFAPEAYAAKQALLFGINQYPNLRTDRDPQQGQLARAVSDAQLMESALQTIGFNTTVVLDDSASRTGMLIAIERFKATLQPGDTVFVFFSGHGVGLSGSNILLPHDIPAIDPGSENVLRQAGILEADLIASIQERLPGLFVLVLDACRNNPIEEYQRRQAAAAGVAFSKSPVMLSRSIAIDSTTVGVFTIYSAGSGEIAIDRINEADPNPNSVFTRIFAQRLKEPGRALQNIILEVRGEVTALAATARDEFGKPVQQHPAYYDGTTGTYVYLNGPPSPETTPLVAALDQAPPLNLGDALAAYDQGLVFYSNRDYLQSAPLFRAAAEKGYDYAFYALGFMAEWGLGQVAAPGEALALYEQAGRAGVTKGMLAAGELLMSGAVPMDLNRARGWFQTAADAGDADGKFHLARMIAFGQGGPSSPDRAGVLFAEALAGGSSKAATAFLDHPEDIPVEGRIEVQQLLVRLGYLSGPVDGLIGRASKDAIRRLLAAR